MEEALELASKFGGVQDRQVHEEIAPYLKNLWFKVITNCIQKHSRRPSSSQVLL